MITGTDRFRVNPLMRRGADIRTTIPLRQGS